MVRITRTSLVATVAVLASLALPGPALAGGCEVLQDVRDRAECTARAEARDAARAEVARQVDGATPGRSGSDDSSGSDGQAHSAAWEQALEEADGVDPSALLEPRPIAAVGGLAWFLVVLRSRRRTRTAHA